MDDRSYTVHVTITNHVQSRYTLCNIIRGSRSLQNLVAISHRYCQSMITLKAVSEGNNGEDGYSIQGLVVKVKDAVANGYFG